MVSPEQAIVIKLVGNLVLFEDRISVVLVGNLVLSEDRISVVNIVLMSYHPQLTLIFSLLFVDTGSGQHMVG